MTQNPGDMQIMARREGCDQRLSVSTALCRRYWERLFALPQSWRQFPWTSGLSMVFFSSDMGGVWERRTFKQT